MPDLQSARTSIRVRRITPGSAFVLGLLTALVASIVAFIVLSAAYIGLDSLGVVSSVNSAMQDLLKFTFNFTYVLYLASGLAVVFFILFPIVFWVSAWIYNLCSGVAGGLKVVVEEE